jgi:hypothetical protein
LLGLYWHKIPWAGLGKARTLKNTPA